MAMKDINIVVEDTPVYIRQWAASTAISNLSKGLEIFGDDLVPFLRGEADFVQILRLLRAAGSNGPEVIQEFVSSARVDGAEIRNTQDYNKIYTGRLTFLFEVFTKVCEVNYKDFFEQGLNSQEQPPQAPQKESAQA